MGFLKSLVNLIATKYGTVTGGKYAGCSLGLGNDNGKKVEVGASFNQLLFLKGTKEVARVHVREVARYETVSDTLRAAVVRLVWASGEESMVQIDRIDRSGKRYPQDRVALVLGALANK